MPIAVVCSECNSRLNAPDAAAGKTLTCPKCASAIVVPAPAAPAFEVVDEPAPPKKAAPVPVAKKPAIVVEVDDDGEDDPPRKKKRPADEDDDDRPRSKKRSRDEDDDEDEKPRKKGKKKAAGSGNMARNIVGIVVLVIALGVAGFVWWDRSKDKEKEQVDNGGNTPTPGQGGTPPGNVQPGGNIPRKKAAGKWTAFEVPSLCRIEFPEENKEVTLWANTFRDAKVTGGVRNCEPNEYVQYIFTYYIHRADSTPEERAKLFEGVTLSQLYKDNGTESGKRKVMMAGQQWEEVTIIDKSVGNVNKRRYIDTGSAFFLIEISFLESRPPNNMERFFNSFAFLK